ncbi:MULTISPECIES: hypothetical protein [Cytobacillus]|nr:hypothetical protein [Cytobacillus oceanisediminis]MCM3243176.1 hypothetical protein [Cytobacillus oceanisediminis]MDK7665419.1 hypothetical protein [Cytobacillus oceanisediminis]
MKLLTFIFILIVEEEIGLVGAQHFDEYFLWNVMLLLSLIAAVIPVYWLV